MYLLVFVIAILCGGAAAAIARAKGRNAGGWFLGGFLLGLIWLGLIPVIVVALLPRMKMCPQCGVKVRYRAPLCYYCGCDFLERAREKEADEYRYCSNCQRAVDKNAHICPICKTPLD